jgi:pyrophosphatase PpaX
LKQINCLLFDLDGTLLDSRDSVIDALYDTSARFLPGMFSRNDLLQRFGESLDDFMRDVEGRLPDAAAKEMFLEAYFTHIRQHQDKNVRLFPGVKEGLQQLKRYGFQLGIVTNKQYDLTVADLRLAEILNLFDTIVALDHVRAGKPAAEPVTLAIRRLRADPGSVLMIGDSRYDVLAAQAASVKSAVLEWYGKEEWQNPVPDRRYANFDQLIEELASVDLPRRT